MKFKFIDLFCGLGGFRIAFEQAGGECVFSSDIDVSVQKTYEMNFGHKPFGDITKIVASDVPNHDILCAGFPCQPFSSAGRRLGFDDTRGTLFFDVARILKEKKPIAFVLENVKGLINHDNGKTLNVILSTLKDIGYTYKYQVLNAKNYNVPQNRERWYCIGVRQDCNIDINNFRFPEQENLRMTLANIIEPSITSSDYMISDVCEKNINLFLKKRNLKITPYTLAYDIRPSRCHFITGGISNCLTAKMGTGGNNVAVVIDQNRKLTERECLKIMGFPNNYKIGRGYMAYKQIGNSVVVPIICKIANQLVKLCSL